MYTDITVIKVRKLFFFLIFTPNQKQKFTITGSVTIPETKIKILVHLYFSH